MKQERGKEVVGLVVGLTSKDTTACIAIIERLKQAANVNSDRQLATAMGLKLSSVSTAKSKGVIPPSWIINAANLFNVSADWLIFGDDSKHLPKETKSAPAIKNEEIEKETSKAKPLEQEIVNRYKAINTEWALDLSLDDFERLWDEYRREKESRRGWLQVEVIKRFPEFLDWLKKREDKPQIPELATLRRHKDCFHCGTPDTLDED